MAETTTLEHDTDQDEKGLWTGAKSPFKSSYGKIMMWYFLISDAFTFAGFLIAYGALRASMPTWPMPDFVFRTFPGLHGEHPLLFVTLMTFVLLFSSFTMIRAVQEGHRENKNGVVFWMLLTVLGGAGFLGCQAWEWKTLIVGENMSVTVDPFGRHEAAGVYLDAAGHESDDTFVAGDSYLMHTIGHGADHAEGGGHGEEEGGDHAADAGGHGATTYEAAGDFPGAVVDDAGYIHRKFKILEGREAGKIMTEEFGPRAFGALFFFITGFHGFHVLTGVLFLLIIMLNVAGGLYVKRKNGYEMVEKIGLYWHFVDLVWVFVFLVFYLI
ncbi:MAG: cytochrome oxidase subunit III [Bacteroidetes bacterium]|nr:MAG: cytochrome oxidase subunit III [Bacteroidota bacterium]